MVTQERQKVVVIVGPTSSGKSEIAVRLAKQFNGEVISADSRQVYRGLNLGTGKITKRETQGIVHHLLDVANPKKEYSAAEWKKAAEKAVADISSRGKLPIIAGGTWFYIRALIDNMSLPKVAANKKLRKDLEKKTVPELFALLKKRDPERAKTIEKSNPRRLIRAIEIATAIGKVPPLPKKQNTYDALIIGIDVVQEKLEKRIARRLYARFRQGMIAETRRLHERGVSWKRIREFGLSYRCVADFLQKRIAKEEMYACALKTEIHYAKQQRKWFKKDKQTKWFAPTQKRLITQAVSKFLT